MICQFFEINIAITSMMKIRVVYDETGTRLRRRPSIRSQQPPQKMQQRNHGKPASLAKVAMEKFALLKHRYIHPNAVMLIVTLLFHSPHWLTARFGQTFERVWNRREIYQAGIAQRLIA